MDRQKLSSKRDKLKCQYNKVWDYLLARLSKRQMCKFQRYNVQPHDLRGTEILQITTNKRNIEAFIKLKELHTRQEGIFLTLQERA